jgi:hypothetical protein
MAHLMSEWPFVGRMCPHTKRQAGRRDARERGRPDILRAMTAITDLPIRPAYGSWSNVNARLRDAVEGLSDEQLAIQPTPERWPIWATIGHLACQRVFWLCDFAGEPGATRRPFRTPATTAPVTTMSSTS